MSGLPLFDAAARGMAEQRALLDVAARNLAAAQAAPPGAAFERLVARAVPEPRDDDDAFSDGADPGDDPPFTFERVPGGGDALTELIAVLDAQRAYEADASVFDVGKRLAERTLDVGRS